jgi:formylglycine-generating enzyme required for sulfatase activity
VSRHSESEVFDMQTRQSKNTAGNALEQTDDTRDRPDRECAFEVVTVDGSGEVVGRETRTAALYVERLGGGISLGLVGIPGGAFLMGSLRSQGYDDERPQHSVRLPAFLLGRCPVTQEQWRAVMGRLPPCRCGGATRPVDRVSWNDARTFCVRLSQRTGRAYRLPAEAEWEYACRAQTTTPFHFGETITTALANYVGEYTYASEPRGIYRHETTDVGSFPPNAFGLYDMHGNVWEWCADAWHDDYTGAPLDGSVWEGRAGSPRVLRGGCWHDPPGLCRSATRLKAIPQEGEDYFGFRVALSDLPKTAESW